MVVYVGPWAPLAVLEGLSHCPIFLLCGHLHNSFLPICFEVSRRLPFEVSSVRERCCDVK